MNNPSVIDNVIKAVNNKADFDFKTDIQTAKVEYVINERDDALNNKSNKITALVHDTIPELNSIYVTFAYSTHNSKHSGLGKLWTGPIKPLMRTFTDVPTRGDDVLIIWVEKNAYYLGPLNSNNSVQFNPNKTVETKTIMSAGSAGQLGGGKITGKDLQGIPRNVEYSSLARLEKPYNKVTDNPEYAFESPNEKMSGEEYLRSLGAVGDTYIEGKFGNSIRLGSRNNSPIVMISNLRQKEALAKTVGNNMLDRVETPSDGGHIALLSEFTIQDHYHMTSPWLPSSNDTNNKDRPIVFDSTYTGNQMYLSSDRIIIDSRASEGGGLNLTSFNDIEMGSNSNINIRSNKTTVLDAEKVYIGKAASAEDEPMVLGTQLKQLLDKIVTAIGNLAVSGTIGGMSGPISSHPSYKGFEAIKNELDDILSNKHFIEKN